MKESSSQLSLSQLERLNKFLTNLEKFPRRRIEKLALLIANNAFLVGFTKCIFDFCLQTSSHHATGSGGLTM